MHTHDLYPPTHPYRVSSFCHFYEHIKYSLLNMLKINGDINQQNLNNFHPLEVVGRGSETQLQLGENSE